MFALFVSQCVDETKRQSEVHRCVTEQYVQLQRDVLNTTRYLEERSDLCSRGFSDMYENCVSMIDTLSRRVRELEDENQLRRVGSSYGSVDTDFLNPDFTEEKNDAAQLGFEVDDLHALVDGAHVDVGTEPPPLEMKLPPLPSTPTSEGHDMSCLDDDGDSVVLECTDGVMEEPTCPHQINLVDVVRKQLRAEKILKENERRAKEELECFLKNTEEKLRKSEEEKENVSTELQSTKSVNASLRGELCTMKRKYQSILRWHKEDTSKRKQYEDEFRHAKRMRDLYTTK